jgi:hypothetical protein
VAEIGVVLKRNTRRRIKFGNQSSKSKCSDSSVRQSCMGLSVLPKNRKDGFPAVHSFGGWKAAVPGSGA